ncbi:MAG: aminotransferase class I/II-fold pyridoxal phosphate-dependent enzyme [Planctomycetia bacterium]|nr:aminotransferase class I/II-fold pyridoxal phosphate-dependent enzyme [Planctomycetia bacterium]
MHDFIPVNEPLLSGNEKKYLEECIDTGWISSEGSFVKKFETEFAKTVNRKYGIGVCNGSAALEVAVAALEIGPGDEVVMPTFTIISCTSAIVRAGAIPVLIDVEKNTWNINVEQIEAKITKRTKAIMVVHIYGLPVNMNPILQLAEKYNLFIIEDTAEVIGQTYYNKPCGSFGDISIFSFYPNKHVTTGEGGMVVTNSKELSEKCKSLRNLCFQQQKRFLHEELGWNFRLSNIQAAVGLAQLEQLDKSIIRKREIGMRYLNNLNDLSGVQLSQLKTEYAENIFWVFGIVLLDEKYPNAASLMDILKIKNIGTRPFFWPMHEQPVFHKMGLFQNESHPNAENIARNGFYIPSGLAITDDQIDFVSETLLELFA